MTGKREQTMRSRSSNYPDGDDIDATFGKLRRDLRLLIWMMGASLVMTTMILIGVLFGDVQI
jgi:hypothetical protein